MSEQHHPLLVKSNNTGSYTANRLTLNPKPSKPRIGRGEDLEVHCPNDGCQYVRGHSGICSYHLEREVEQLRLKGDGSRAQIKVAYEEIRDLHGQVEVLQDLIERMNEREESEALQATADMMKVLKRKTGIEDEVALMSLAMDLIEAARAHLRDEFKKTLAKNLVSERDKLRRQVKDLERLVDATPNPEQNWRRLAEKNSRYHIDVSGGGGSGNLRF